MAIFESYGAQPGEVGVTAQQMKPQGQPVQRSYGNICVVGAFDRGPTDRAVEINTPQKALRVLGSAIEGHQGAIQLGHFFKKLKKNQVQVRALRVTDGSERQSWAYLYDRDASLNVATKYGADKLRSKVCKLQGYSGTTAFGRQRYYGGQVADVQAAITGSAFDTGSSAFLKDELIGATLRIVGLSNTWLITANTAAGVVTVQGDFTAVVATGAQWWWIDLPNTDKRGNKRGLGVSVVDGFADPSLKFGLVSYVNGQVVTPSYLDVGLDTPNNYATAVAKAIRNQEQFELRVTNLFSGNPALGEKRPANWAGIPDPSQAITNRVYLQMIRWQKTSAAVIYPASISVPSGVRPHKLVLTALNGTTYTVAAYDVDHDGVNASNVIAEDLGNATVGSPWAAPLPFLISFTPTGTPSANDVIEIYVDALPSNLKAQGAKLFPVANSSNPGSGLSVVNNGWNWVDVSSSVDLAADHGITAPGVPTVLSGAYTPADTTGATLKYLVLDPAGNTIQAEVTLTITGAVSQSLTALVAELEAQELAGSDLVTWTETADGKIQGVWSEAGNALYGPGYKIKITDGTLNTISSLFADNTEHAGATPSVMRLEFQTEAQYGTDGLAASLVNPLIDALDVNTSPLNPLTKGDLGLVRLLTPGINDPSVQSAALQYVQANNWRYISVIDSSVTTVDGAINYRRSNLTSNGKQDRPWPAHGLIDDPFNPQADLQVETTGAWCGVRAAVECRGKGYHNAAFGEDQDLDFGDVFKSLLTDVDGQPVELDNQKLNQAGFVEIRHIGPRIIPYGNNTLDENGDIVKIHAYQARQHITNLVRVEFARYIGRPISTRLFAEIAAHADRFMRTFTEIEEPWFVGDTPSEQYEIRCDLDINPISTQQQGLVYLQLAFTIVGAAERVVVQVAEQGVFVKAA